MADSPSTNCAMPKKQQNPSLESLPTDLLLDIFAKVAFYSIEDISYIKLTCKEFLRVAEHDYVYHNSSLEKFALQPLEWINSEKPFRHYVQVLSPNEEGSLNVIKVFEWKLTPEQRFNKERQAYFLRRCKESNNPKIMYREGMLEYFRETSSSSSIALAFENLKTAALNGQDDAMYVYNMLLM
ncbi:putative F-box protein At1g67623 [Gastrolobium bilobum]|uniref:putative F-box protein At1g67623 n=1 Tax=Gastrolobium bilobum TaxID=150636 RepID=UPI002AB23782|nr:putative F-box protein At1g67623 [Gastrolobium bilobum]